MQNAFGRSIRNDVNWSRIDARLNLFRQQNPNSMLIDLIQRFELTGMSAEAGSGNSGTVANNGSITIDPSMLRKTASGAAAMTQQDVDNLLIALAHEISHALNPDVRQREWTRRPDLADGTDAMLDNEAKAYTDMYRAARELGLVIPPVFTNQANSDLITTLDGLLQTHGNNLNDPKRSTAWVV